MADRYRVAARIKVFLKNPVWGTDTTDAYCLVTVFVGVVFDLSLSCYDPLNQ